MEQYMLAVIATSTLFVTDASALQCYECHVNPFPGETYSTTPLCTHFDHSTKFVVDCPDSTMCTKKEVSADFPNDVEVMAVQRGCTFQKYEFQDIRNGSWRQVVKIMEPYEEGCQVIEDKEARIPSTKLCYCRGDLCNSSPTSNHEGYTDVMGVIVVFNLMKYINSLR